MTQPSDRTIRELVNDLYHRLDIGSRPRSAEARLLEQITLAADALQPDPRVAALEAYVRFLEDYYVGEWQGVGETREECLQPLRAKHPEAASLLD